MSKLTRMSTRELETLAREIKADIKDGRLTRREEEIATDDLNAVLDELDYRERDERNQRPREKSYGGIETNTRSHTRDVGSFFNKTTESTMTSGSLFNSGNKGLNKGFAPEPTENNVRREREEPRRSTSSNKEHKVFFSPKYPFVTSPNVKEVLEETTENDDKTVWHIKKRTFVGNDDAVDYAFDFKDNFTINPLYSNNTKQIAYVSNIENPKIPKTILPNMETEETIKDLTFTNKVINKFIFNEISLEMTNCIQAIDYYVKLKDLDDIKAFLSKQDFRTEYLKHISKIFKSYKIDIKDDYIELNLNRKHIYADVDGLIIPGDTDKFFVNESSNETLYQLISNISREYKTYSGVIEGFDFRFSFYIGFNKILLVRA